MTASGGRLRVGAPGALRRAESIRRSRAPRGEIIVRNAVLPRARKAGLSRWAPLLAVAGALSLSSGCMHHGGGGHPGTPGTTMPAHAVDFTLTEGHIALDGTVASGRNQVHVTNSGNFEHEIIFVKAESAASLPTKADGSMDESKLPRGSVLGEIELDA